MVSLESLVYIVVYLLIAALVLGLLWWLIGYVERQGLGTPGPALHRPPIFFGAG
jgi:hypothetical protein